MKSWRHPCPLETPGMGTGREGRRPSPLCLNTGSGAAEVPDALCDVLPQAQPAGPHPTDTDQRLLSLPTGQTQVTHGPCDNQTLPPPLPGPVVTQRGQVML